jgi:hypothetical protein
MFSPVHAIKSNAAAAVVLVGAPLPSYAQTIGSVRIHLAKAGFIAGVGGGSGTLHYRGRTYPLGVGGSASARSEWHAQTWWAGPTICGSRRTLRALIRRSLEPRGSAPPTPPLHTWRCAD